MMKHQLAVFQMADLKQNIWRTVSHYCVFNKAIYLEYGSKLKKKSAL